MKRTVLWALAIASVLAAASGFPGRPAAAAAEEYQPLVVVSVCSYEKLIPSKDSMMADRNSCPDIGAAMARAEEAFPFKDYITKGKRQGILYVVGQVARHCQRADPALLDIGSGPMDITAVFAQLGYACCAIDDLSDPWHRRGNNLDAILDFAQRMGIRFHLQSIGEYSIPFARDSFDVVTLNGVIEHLHESPRGILNAAGSHLRSGGLLCITMPNAVNLRKRLSVLRGWTNYPPVDQLFLSPGPWRGHVREYTLAETARLCEMAGYQVAAASTFESIAYDKLKGLARRVYLLLGCAIPTLRSGLCVIARKPDHWTPAKDDPEAYRKALEASVPPGVR